MAYPECYYEEHPTARLYRNLPGFLSSLKQLTIDDLMKLVVKWHFPMKYSGEHPDSILNRNLPGFTLFCKTINDLKTVGN